MRWIDLLLIGGLLMGCQASDSVWLEALELAHGAADSANTAEQRQQALSQLESAYWDIPTTRSARVHWVRQDACARIAALALDLGDLSRALDWTERGLEVSSEASVATADLLLHRGRALEALGRREEAVAALHQALVINQSLMERALSGHSTRELEQE